MPKLVVWFTQESDQREVSRWPERHDEQEQEEPASLAKLTELTTVIVAAYVTRTAIAMADLGT